LWVSVCFFINVNVQKLDSFINRTYVRGKIHKIIFIKITIIQFKRDYLYYYNALVLKDRHYSMEIISYLNFSLGIEEF
jgi:hypothetical protein